MTRYLAIMRARIVTLLQYRAAAFAGLCTQVFWGLIRIIVFTAFFTQAGQLESITLTQTICFIWIGQAFFQLIPYNIDKELEWQIKTGHVAYELVRPLDLYWHWFARAFAMRLVPTLMRCLPLFILAALFFNLPAPVSLSAGLAFTLSCLIATLLSTSITTLLMISLFWTLSGEGILRLAPHFVMLLSGMFVPIPLFPEWMQPFLLLQPFRFLVDIPCRLYTGMIPAEEAFAYIACQIAWTCAFILTGKLLMRRATSSLVIQGG